MQTEITDSADRRTSLAAERTLLAWWRTGLTSIAVALGVGRLLPELASDTPAWPYAILGIAFAAYGIAFFLYGTRRMAAFTPSEDRQGDAWHDRALAPLMIVGVLLGIGTVVLIVTQ